MASRVDILTVRDLKVYFPIRRGIFARTCGFVKAVDGVSFSLARGETLGLVGESGCGKSTTARAILSLVRPTSGEIRCGGRVQVVFQDPLASLNPRQTVREILSDAPLYHGLWTKAEATAKSRELLADVGLPETALGRYPHEFSGGECQRLCIARAIALKPEILICDEAVSALDLSIRAHILDLLAALKKKLDLSILFITHDLGVVQHVADRILVMNRGRIVEEGECRAVLAAPKDPYTRRLIASVPRLPPVPENPNGPFSTE